MMRRLGNLKNILLSSERVASLSSLCTDISFGETFIRFLSLKSDCVSAGLKKENSALVNNLEKMGVDIQLVRKRQPGVLQRQTTNENGLKEFLQAKGANAETIINIISRYPRSITRSSESLTERWEIWRSILMTDEEIVTILKRSPESFFRSGNNLNLKENIDFFCSLGLTTKDLSSMLTRVPRAFSNSVELNKQMVAFLKDICVNLGGGNPDYFVKRLLSRNVFILLRSVKQVTANVELLQTSFNLDCETLQTLLLGQGADILDLSTVYVKKSFANIKEKLLHHGCTEREINTFVLKHLRILYLSTQKFNQKIDLLLQANINIRQILKCPPVLEVSINTISTRLDDLKKIDFNFEINGIDIIALNKQRYEARFAKLKCT